VVGQVPWLLWWESLREIQWGADDRHTHVRPNTDCDHVLRHLLAESHAGVIPLGDDVGQGVVDGDLDLDVRILPQEFRKFRPEDRVGRIVGGRDPNRAGTAGCGLVQSWGGPIEEIRPGDVIWCPPGEKHWHGATPTTAMTHIAIVEQLDGKAVDWMEKVSDEQYKASGSEL